MAVNADLPKLSEAELNAPDLDEEGLVDVESYQLSDGGEIEDPYLAEVWDAAVRQLGEAATAEEESTDPAEEKGIRGVHGYFNKDWITIGGSPGERGENQGGTHVFIDGSGKIVAGPAALTGKPINRLDQGKLKPGEKPKPPKPPKKPEVAKPEASQLTDYVGKPLGKGQSTPKALYRFGDDVVFRMSGAQRQHLKAYTGNSYDRVNKPMRQCPPKFECVKSAAKEMMDAVNSAVSVRLSEPVTVYRGCSVADNVAAKLLAAARDSQQSGADYGMPCITSTSFRADTKFMEEANVVFHIRAKTGVPVKSISVYKNEEELVQSSSAKYRVVGVSEADHKSGKKQVIYLEEQEWLPKTVKSARISISVTTNGLRLYSKGMKSAVRKSPRNLLSVRKTSGDQVLQAMDQIGHGSDKFTSLRDLGQRIGGSPQSLHQAVMQLWRERKVTVAPAEGRHGSTPEDRRWWLEAQGETFGYVMLRQ